MRYLFMRVALFYFSPFKQCQSILWYYTKVCYVFQSKFFLNMFCFYDVFDKKGKKNSKLQIIPVLGFF